MTIPELSPMYKHRVGLKDTAGIASWLSSNYAKLDNGGFEYLGSEPNTDPESKWDTAELKVLVIRLSTYGAVDCSMTHSLLAQILHRGARDRVFVDHCYLPPHKDYDAFVKNNIPLWFGATSKRPATDFDLLVVSHSVCMERLNLPRLMKLSGIPLFKPLRMKDEAIPMMVMGGANVFSVEDLYGSLDGSEEHSCLVDATVVGAGEYSLAQVRDVVLEGKKAGLDKASILKNCHGRVEGFYEPDKYKCSYGPLNSDGSGPTVLKKIERTVDHVALPIVKAKVRDLDKAPTLEEGILFYTGGNGGAADIEIARGCPAQCSFCQESWLNKPYMERSLEHIKETAKVARRLQGAQQMNLYSFNWNHYSKIYELVSYLMSEMGTINLISNRLDVQCQDPALASLMKAAGNMNTTVGIEGVSERMRRFLHKTLTEPMIIAGLTYLMEAGFAEVKMFMIVSGYETKEDILEFCTLLRRLNQIRREKGYGTLLRISFMPIFTSAGAPLQFYSCESALQIKERTLDVVVQTCRENKIGFRTGAKRSEIEVSQLLEMADRRLAPLVLKASIEDEYIFYGMVPSGYRDTWAARLEGMGLNWKMFFREKHLSNVFPWEHIYPGVSKNSLWERYKQSLEYSDESYCLSMLRRKGKCTNCGGCPTPKHIKDITRREVNMPISLEEMRAHKRNMSRLRSARLLLRIADPMNRTMPKRYYGQVVARALMMADDGLGQAFLAMRSHSRVTASVNEQKDWVYGRVMVDVSFNDASITEEYIRNLIPEINKYMSGLTVDDVYMSDKLRLVRGDVDLALYRVDFMGVGAPSYHKVRHGVEAYFRALQTEKKARIRNDAVISIEMLDRKGVSTGKTTLKDLRTTMEFVPEVDPEARGKPKPPPPPPPVLVTYTDVYDDNREKVAKGIVSRWEDKAFTVKIGGLKIKKRVVEMKGAFRTVEVDLDRSKVVMVNADFTGKGTRVVFLADNKLNPYALLETLLGGKQWQYRPFPVEVLGYYNKTEEKKGEVTVDLRALLKAKRSGAAASSVCASCGGPVETDAFSGGLYKAICAPSLCIACDFNGGASVTDEFEQGEPAKVSVGVSS